MTDDRDGQTPATDGGRERLVRVATARHQSEAEFYQGILREEGIASMLRRTQGFDVPEMLVAGPHDVVVRAPDVARARAALEPVIETPSTARPTSQREPLVVLGVMLLTVGLLIAVGLLVI